MRDGDVAVRNTVAQIRQLLLVRDEIHGERKKTMMMMMMIRFFDFRDLHQAAINLTGDRIVQRQRKVEATITIVVIC